MNERGFVIKVSDLLANVGSVDTITFSGKKSTRLPEVTEDGISGTIIIKSINNDAIHVTVEELSASRTCSCDMCGKEFLSSTTVLHGSTKFIDPSFHDAPDEDIHDEAFFLNMKNETIDIEEFVVQSIILAEEVVYRCDECDEIDLPADNMHTMGGSVRFVTEKKK